MLAGVVGVAFEDALGDLAFGADIDPVVSDDFRRPGVHLRNIETHPEADVAAASLSQEFLVRGVCIGGREI